MGFNGPEKQLCFPTEGTVVADILCAPRRKRREKPKSNSMRGTPEIKQLIMDVQAGLSTIGYPVIFDVPLLLKNY